MHTRHILFIAAIVVFASCTRGQELINGHAHNDYENENPLHDALDNGFISVEVDVHLIDNNLFVSHDLPEELNPELTLEALYLSPLKNHIESNRGYVYPHYSGPFYLLIDFKSSAKPSYDKLKEILDDFLSIISVVRNGIEQKGNVTILISGNRPVEEILNDEPQLVRIDGRPADLNNNIPTSIMPLISYNYTNMISWTGYGELVEEENQNLKRLVQETHAQNKILRLWASPDNENVWKYLIENGVDLINTDHLSEFRTFYLNNN